MDTLQKRLKHAMSRANIDIAGLARRLEISYQAVKKAVDGKTKSFGSATNFRAAHFLGVDPVWLSTGDGPMESGPVENHTSIPNAVNLSSGFTSIPLLDRQSAGMHKSYTQDGKEPPRKYKHAGPVGPGTFAYLVDDDTMEPDFRVGTIAIIECDTLPQHGDVVLVQDNTGAYLRKLVMDGDLQYLETITGRLPARPLTATLIGWVSGEYHPRRSR